MAETAVQQVAEVDDAGLVTSLPNDFIDEFEREILGKIPAEKVQVELRQQRNARIMQAAGSVNIEGLGQKVAEIDARLYFRMLYSFGDPTQSDWLHDLLADNPQLCAPGYKPKRKSDFRHGRTFVGGKPI